MSTPDGGGRRRGRTALAALLVFVALVIPTEFAQVTPWAFARIPVEALVGGALLLVLAARPRRVVATVAGTALGLLTILKVLDLGFSAVLARPFNPVLDRQPIASGLQFLGGSIGRAGAVGVAIGCGLLVVVVLVVLTVAVRRLAVVGARYRAGTTRALAALGVVWLTCAVLGAQLVAGMPVADRSTVTFAQEHAVQAYDSLNDRDMFAGELAHDRFHDAAGSRLLAALRGKDVVFAVIESYGRSAVADPRLAPRIDAVLADGDRKLTAAGFAARSAFLTSPTTGGGSWLAHATLLSGAWVDNQQRYGDLHTSDRLTLGAAFHRAGWRTVGVMPGVTSGFPQTAFYGYDHIYDAPNLGYHGPNFSWATMPDQYTLSMFQRLERARAGHAPVMAEIPLVSSHAPWAPLPRLVGWDQVGDGSVYAGMAGRSDPTDVIFSRDPDQVRDDYRRSIEYSLTSLISYVQTYGDDNLVLVFLGDHQPTPFVTGWGAGADVPVTVVARDPAVLDRVSGWGWQDGLRPGPQAPVWRMDEFRDRFLTTFGS